MKNPTAAFKAGQEAWWNYDSTAEALEESTLDEDGKDEFVKGWRYEDMLQMNNVSWDELLASCNLED